MESINPESIKGAVVRKSNDLIEAKYQIHDLGEQRVIFMLLAQIQPNDEDFKSYRLSVSDFATVLGLKGNSTYETLDKITRSLVSRTITIRNETSFLHVNWLSSAEYKNGSGYVELAFDPKLKPYLLQLKSHFTQYRLDSILHFKSVYSIRLYEYLKKEAYKAKSGKFEKHFEYLELRNIFSIGDHKYLNFGHFKSKTVIPAVSEIDQKSDLNIYDVQYGKIGKKITSITFFVQIRSDDVVLSKIIPIDIKHDHEKEHHVIIDSLIDLGFALETAHKFKNKYGVKKIERNIAFTLAKKQSGMVNDIPAYLNKAIENDWGGSWEIEREKEDIKKKKQQDDIKNKQKIEQQQAIEKQQASDQLIDWFFMLPQEQKSSLINDFLNNTDDVSKKLFVKSFDSMGESAIRKNRISRSLFACFLKSQ